MKPSALYAMPSRKSEEWHRMPSELEPFFGADCHRIDREKAQGPGSPDVRFEQKIYRNIDGERIVAYWAVTFEGRPVGVLYRAGRGGEDRQAAFVTDTDGYGRAKSAIMRCMEQTAELEIVHADVDIPELDDSYGFAVVGAGAEARLVPSDHLSPAGGLLFDEEAYADHLSARPDGYAPGMPRDRNDVAAWRGTVREALLAGVATGMRRSGDYRFEGRNPNAAGVVAADDVSTWLIESSATANYTWMDTVRVRRIGDAYLFDAIVAEVAVAPKGP